MGVVHGRTVVAAEGDVEMVEGAGLEKSLKKTEV